MRAASIVQLRTLPIVRRIVPARPTSNPLRASAPFATLPDERAEFFRRREDDRDAVAAHARAGHDRLARIGALLAGIRHQPDVGFPDFVYLAVGGLHAVRIAA